VAESAIICAAVKLGIGVSKPLTDGERYDLIFDLRSRLVRVQCKWANQRGDVIVVRCYSSRRGRERLMRRRYPSDEVDAIAAYCAELDRCYFLPASIIDNRAEVSLRVGSTRNGQLLRIRWADDFDIGRLDWGQLMGP
jgi:PD-(D/E)XK endonuclease